jgi:opacity protein-like surface antigen
MTVETETSVSRVSKGRAARTRKAARRTVMTVAMASMLPVIGAGSALAQCARPSGAGASVFDFIPLASGTAVSSIIATISSVNTSSLAQSTALVSTPPNPAPDSQGGGRWSRVIAGTVETENNTSTTATVGPLANATVDCRATTSLDFIGTQAGMDIGKFNFAGGGNIHWGFTTGYFDVSAKDKTPGISTFSSDNQIPFAGLYLALSSGNFSIDAQVRGDFYHMELSDTDQGMFKQPITARGVAFLWNAAYRFDLPNNWFIEPSIGGVSSRTEIDRIDVAGGINVPVGLTPSLTFPGSVQIDDVNSLLGRASVRIGTTFVDGKIAWQPFATGSVFHEFAGNVRTDMSTLLVGFPLSATSTTSREGTFGHIGVGLAGVLLDTGWLGYIRGDYRFGENIEGISVNAGLRYQFTPSDIKASMKDGGSAGHSAPFNWTGLYAGWSTGAVWGEEHWTFSNGATTSPKYQGAAVGGQLGYNWQIGHTVLGVEVDYNWSNAEGGQSCPNGNFFSCVAEMESIGFLTGRLGYAHQRALYYVKGGLAVAEVTPHGKFNLDGAGLAPAVALLSPSDTKTGWAIGAGMEYALTDRWTVRGEWMHFDLGKEDFVFEAGGTPTSVDTVGNIARVGVNYHFGHRGHDYGHEPMK